MLRLLLTLKNRLIVTAADVSSKYTRRTALEYTRIGQYIKAITNSRRGNYLVFFPSYTFRDEVELVWKKKKMYAIFARKAA